MISSPTQGWTEQVAGHDRTLVRRVGPATMVFGLGPARGAAAEPDRLAAIIGSGVASLRHDHQVHGRTIHRTGTGSERVADMGPGDGLVTTDPGVGLLVFTADCVPVLLAAEGVVAAVHSGWRGCAVDVAAAAVELMAESDLAAPEGLRAALGPSVCGRCYEVGPEVVRALRAFDLEESRWLDGNHVDLRGFLRVRLEALGVPAENIVSVGGCTVESGDLASFRRDGEAAGRQWSMVYLNP